MLFKRLKAKARRLPSYAKHQVIDVFEDNDGVICFLKQKIIRNEFEFVVKELKSCVQSGKSKLFKEILELVGITIFEKNGVAKGLIYSFEESGADGAVECLEFFCSFICKHKAFDLILGASGHAKGRSIGSLGSGDFLCHEDNWFHPMAMLSLSNLLVQVVLESKDLHEAAATLRACCFEWLDVEFGDKKTGAAMLQMSSKMLGEHPVWLYPVERPCALEVLSKKGFKKSGALLLSVLGEERFKSLRYLYGNESLAHLAARELDVYAWQYCLDNHIGFPGKESTNDLDYKEIRLKKTDLPLEENAVLQGLIDCNPNFVPNFDSYLYTVFDGYLRSQSTELAKDSGWEWISKSQLSSDEKCGREQKRKSLSSKWIDAFSRVTLSEVQHLKMKEFSKRVYKSLQKTCDDCLEEYSEKFASEGLGVNDVQKMNCGFDAKISKNVRSVDVQYVHPMVVLSERLKAIDEQGAFAKKTKIIELMLSEAIRKQMYPRKNSKDWHLFWGNLNEQNKSFVEKILLENSIDGLAQNCIKAESAIADSYTFIKEQEKVEMFFPVEKENLKDDFLIKKSEDAFKKAL